MNLGRDRLTLHLGRDRFTRHCQSDSLQDSRWAAGRFVVDRRSVRVRRFNRGNTVSIVFGELSA
jgi:hypothetical protein